MEFAVSSVGTGEEVAVDSCYSSRTVPGGRVNLATRRGLLLWEQEGRGTTFGCVVVSY